MKRMILFVSVCIMLLAACSPETAPAAQPSIQPSPQLEAKSVEIVSTILPTVTPNHTPISTPTPTPIPTPTPAPTPFTLAWISDTQDYALGRPDPMNAMADWLIENREAENIVFVAHTGDVVDNGTSDWQWEHVNPALERILEHYPAIFASGNHDVTGSGSSRYFLKQNTIISSIPEGQSFSDGAGSYALFNAGGTDFIIVSVYWNADYGTYKEAVVVLNQYSGHTALIVTHSALESDGSWTGPGSRLSGSVVAVCPNVRLVLCGHYRGSVRREDYYDDDGDGEGERKVVTMMYNFQGDREKGLGYLRLVSFDPEFRSISIRTYSPYYDDFNYFDDDADKDEFIIEQGY